MDRLTVTETTWREMDAWMIAGPELEVVVTKIGAHLAAVRVPGEELNPLWQPPWKATTPEEGATSLPTPAALAGRDERQTILSSAAEDSPTEAAVDENPATSSDRLPRGAFSCL